MKFLFDVFKACFIFTLMFFGLCFMLDLGTAIAFAQETVPTISPDAEFLRQVWEAIKTFGGLDFVARCSLVVMLLISSMKVSLLRPLWTKLGAAKPFAALILSFIAGLLDAFIGQPEFSWAIVFAYTFAGVGAGYIHDLLDAAKNIPGLGAVYVTIINVLMEALGGARVKKEEEEQQALRSKF